MTDRDHAAQTAPSERTPGEQTPGERAPSEGAPGEQAEAERLKAEAVLTVLRLFRALERVDSGLTPQQYRILKLVGAGGERSARLAEKLAVAKPTLTATADGLVAAGLVHREAEVGDRRVVRLRLTPAGADAMARADSAYCDWLTGLLDAVAEPGQILTDLDLLGGALDELHIARLAGSRLAGPATKRGPVSQPANWSGT